MTYVFFPWHSTDEVSAYAGGKADAASRWHLEHFGNASAIWTADEDNDQLNRLFEYALGGDRDQGIAQVSVMNLPSIQILRNWRFPSIAARVILTD